MDCVTQVPGPLTSTGAQPTGGGRTRVQYVYLSASTRLHSWIWMRAVPQSSTAQRYPPMLRTLALPLALSLLQQVIMIPISGISRSAPLISSLDPGCTFTRVNTLFYELSSVIPFECAICLLSGALIHTRSWEVDMLKPHLTHGKCS